MSKAKRLFAFVLCLMFIVSTLAMPAAAAKQKTYEIKNFGSKTTINADMYHAMRSGKMSVKWRKGCYQYRFSKGNVQVYVYPSAFTCSTVSNPTFSNAKSKLTDGVMAYSGNMNGCAVIYREGSKKNINVALTGTSGKYFKKAAIVDLAYLEVTSDLKAGESAIELKCTNQHFLEFEYRYNIHTLASNKFKNPTTKAELEQALKIRTTGKMTNRVTPVMKVTVTQPGTTLVNLQTAKFTGKGYSSTSIDVKTKIDVYVETGKVLYKLVTKNIKLKDLTSLYSAAEKLSKKSSEYSSDDIYLYKYKTKQVCYLTVLESPIELMSNKDYVKMYVDLNKSFKIYKNAKAVPKNVTPTKINIEFSAK